MLISTQYADLHYLAIYAIGIAMILKAVILMFVDFKTLCVALGRTPTIPSSKQEIPLLITRK